MFQGLTKYIEGVCRINDQLQEKEEQILKLTRQTKRQRDRGSSSRDGNTGSRESSSDPHLPPSSVPDLEQILRLPLANLERELQMSRQEYRTLVASIDATISESKRIQADLEAIQGRCSAGDIYITNLESDLETAECEGEQLQREFDWILSLPPSAFASQEMLEWLKKDRQLGDLFESDSELGLEITASCINVSSSSAAVSPDDDSNILLPDQVHPARVKTGVNVQTSNNISSPGGRIDSRHKADPGRSCSTGSTGSTSSGISVDTQSMASPEPSSTSFSSNNSSGSAKLKIGSPSPPALPPKRSILLKHSHSKVEEDNNSDTGLSSLNSSGEEQIYCLDTLV